MKILDSIWKKFLKERQPTKVVTIRYMFPLVMLSIFALLGAAVIKGNEKSYVRLEPSQTMVMKDEHFSIDIYAYAHIPVNAIDIAVEFSPDMVEVESVDTGRSVLTIWTKEPVIENDTIMFGGGTYRRGFLGEHLVATIKVKAKYSGKTEFMVRDAQLLAGDGKGTAVMVDEASSLTKTSFYIYDQNEDPSQITAKLGIRINPDIDGDGNVSLRDISAFMASWQSKDTTYDFNDDGRMNFFDFSIILAKSFIDS